MQRSDSIFDEGRFFLGSICKRSHDWSGSGHSLRTIKKRECVDCLVFVQKRWREQNPDKVAAGRTKYNQQERVKEYKRLHYQRNEEKYRAAHRQHYLENKADHAAKGKAYYLEHREETLQYYREYQARHRDRIQAQHREYYQKHRVHFAVLGKLYREENRETIRERRKGYRLPDSESQPSQPRIYGLTYFDCDRSPRNLCHL
jgi:hypothetical protein